MGRENKVVADSHGPFGEVPSGTSAAGRGGREPKHLPSEGGAQILEPNG